METFDELLPAVSMVLDMAGISKQELGRAVTRQINGGNLKPEIFKIIADKIDVSFIEVMQACVSLSSSPPSLNCEALNMVQTACMARRRELMEVNRAAS